jgi:hypothetical protein
LIERFGAENVIERQGRAMVLWPGLLGEAHKKNVKSIRTELLRLDVDVCVAVVKATVEMEDGRVFEGIGDASPKNVSATIAPHYIRMAETRAKARALRDAVNVSGDEDIPDDEIDHGAQETRPARPNTAASAAAAYQETLRRQSAAPAADRITADAWREIAELSAEAYRETEEQAKESFKKHFQIDAVNKATLKQASAYVEHLKVAIELNGQQAATAQQAEMTLEKPLDEREEKDVLRRWINVKLPSLAAVGSQMRPPGPNATLADMRAWKATAEKALSNG